MSKTPPSAVVAAAKLGRRANVGVRALGADEEFGPMMTELRRRAEEQLRALEVTRRATGRKRKLKPGEEGPLQELQIQQVELEMQNDELKQARDRLEELLEKYTDLYDFSPAGYFSLDEQGVILEANLTGAALLGLERSRIIQRTWQSFVPPASRPMFLAFLKQVFEGTGKLVCELPLLKQNAGVFWADLQAVPASLAKGPGKWCRLSVSDITALKKAEEILRRNEALFSTLIQQAPVGVYVLDDQLRLREVNSKAEPFFSQVRPLLGLGFPEAIHHIWSEKTAMRMMERFRHTLKTGEPYREPDHSERRRDLDVVTSYEWQIQRITLPGGQHGVVCFFTDITERKRAEAAQRHVEVLAASNRKLEAEAVRRKASEEALKKSERDLSEALAQSQLQAQQTRRLSHQILQAQEEERKCISRELHDEIAQTLVGLNIHLETLARDVTANPKGLRKTIVRTQRLMEKSVGVVHRFARDLRPTLLDDLGLIPALHAYMKEFTERTRVLVQFSAFAGVEKLSSARRTVLYRVAQSALTNIAQHAEAGRVRVSLQKVGNTVRMEIHDDGKSFNVERVLFAKRHKRLGLLGTRERVEMVGGNFGIESSPGHGTTLTAQIPFANEAGTGGSAGSDT